MAATLRDVAAASGVSIRTVSNVVNGYAPVTPNKRRRVEEAVEALGYTPNLLARSLKQGRSRVIALVLPELRNPYFAELVSAFVAEGSRRGYTVMIDQTNGDPEHEAATLRRVAQNVQFDAVVVSPLGLSADEVRSLAPRGPLVLLGEDGHPDLDHVLVDNEQAAYAATRHLLDQGRRRLVAIGSAQGDGRATSSLRHAGFRRALEEAGLPSTAATTIEIQRYDRAAGEAAMEEIHARGLNPDGVFCFIDVVAIGLLHRAHQLGVRVPDDLAVVGFDDIEEARYARVPLTSIDPHREWIASTAFDLLVSRLADPDVPARRVLGDWRLVERDSSGSPTA